MGQQDGVGLAVVSIYQAANLVGHGVTGSENGVGKGNAGVEAR